jgi:DNA-binding NarL/FixJ family response regulator
MSQLIRVLIADDNARSRRGLRALLATWPEIEVVSEAVNGQEAVHQVADYRPDVVLMDARMPFMDGLEATRLIKRRWPDIKIVILTIYTHFRTEAMAAGADAFLIKGCPGKELLTAILS